MKIILFHRNEYDIILIIPQTWFESNSEAIHSYHRSLPLTQLQRPVVPSFYPFLAWSVSEHVNHYAFHQQNSFTLTART